MSVMNSPAIPIAFALVAIFCVSFIVVNLLFWAIAAAFYILPWIVGLVIVVWLSRAALRIIGS